MGLVPHFVTTAGAACRVLRFVLAGLLVLGAVANVAAQPVKQVLVLQSFHRGNIILDTFTTDFRVELDQRAEQPVNFVQVVVGPTGSVDAPEQAVVDFIVSTFADDPKPDLIVALAGPASVFARKYRRLLFPDTPLLFAAVDERFLRDAPLGENEAAVAAANDFPRLVDDILQVLPDTRQVFVVTGAGLIGNFWRRELEEQFTRFHGRLSFVWLDGLSLSEILRRSASLPNDSVLFYVTFGTDAAGAAYADERVLADLRATANAPLFGAQSVYLGAGAVGGSMMPMADLSRDTAEVAIRLLNGAPPRSITGPPRQPGPPIFDWRELQRWRIPESRLPANSTVLYRGASLWSEYKFTVLGAAGALVVQLVLIAGLLYQRRARQRAEIDSKKNLVLAADASRRETMAALTNSITHELGQPLGSMVSNAHALQMMVAANRATPDTIGEILSDIRAQGVSATQIIERHRTMLRSRQLDRHPLDLHGVIHESLALVAHDMRARQVEAVVILSSSPCVIVGDPVLLQQVVVNLVMNAMDAMAGTPPARRQVTIRSEVRAVDVELSVSDNGTGLPAHLDSTLFTPFVTTKSHGLGIGLTIVRSIVDAHEGTIDACNNLQGGATFTVTLQRGGTTAAGTGQ